MLKRQISNSQDFSLFFLRNTEFYLKVDIQLQEISGFVELIQTDSFSELEIWWKLWTITSLSEGEISYGHG